ncbi:MAG: GGDEF domain-containing protein, partial [Pseudomonadales bacterium]
ELNSGEAALIFIDLDNFKYVNDHYGHKFGDTVLCYIAEQLKNVVADQAFICRFGGDEFVALLDSADKPLLESICSALITPFRTPLFFDSKRIKIGLSIGVCIFDSEQESFSSVCQRADQAMYNVKNRGKNNYAFFE